MQIFPPYRPGSAACSDTSIPSVTLPLSLPGPNSACNDVPQGHWEQRLAQQASVLEQAQGLGMSPGCWVLHCACWWQGQPLGFRVSGAGHWKLPPPWLHCKNEWEKTGGLQKRITLRLTKSLKKQLIAAEKLLEVCEWWLDLSFKQKILS